MKNDTQIPVLILAFNRPKLVQELLSKLDKSKISKLYVSIDGPRNASDHEKSNEILNLVTNFSDKLPVSIRRVQSNLGCRLGVISGLDWFFSQVPGGLILEDDCHPKNDLFNFIIEHKDINHSKRMGMITAHNPYNEIPLESYLSRFVFIHGWYMKSQIWSEIRKDLFSIHLPTIRLSRRRKAGISETIFWWSAYMRARIGIHDTWDSLFYQAFMINEYYCLVPKTNMIDNKGFGSEATHTFDSEYSIIMERGAEIAFNLNSSTKLDNEISRTHFKIQPHHKYTPFVKVVIDFIKVRHFPNFEQQMQNSNSEFLYLNQADR